VKTKAMQFVTWDYCIYSFPSSALSTVHFLCVHILPIQISLNLCIILFCEIHNPGSWVLWWAVALLKMGFIVTKSVKVMHINNHTCWFISLQKVNNDSAFWVHRGYKFCCMSQVVISFFLFITGPSGHKHNGCVDVSREDFIIKHIFY